MTEEELQEYTDKIKRKGGEPTIRYVSPEEYKLLVSKYEIETNTNHSPKPHCHGLDFCTCHLSYLEPDEDCPFHGSNTSNKCVKCGRFFSKENPKTCPTYKG